MLTSSDIAIRRDLGIVFTPPGVSELRLDLVRPAGDDEAPLVIYLHGGGWAIGTRDQDTARFEGLVAHGFAVASVDYRLTGEATWPAQLDDARLAVAWLRSHGAEYGLATERIGAWGASAGGHLAAMLGMAPGATPQTAVQAVVGFFGTYDLTERAADAVLAPGAAFPSFLLQLPLQPNVVVPTDPVAQLLGVQAVQDAPDLARDASPVTHADSASPPTLLVHGEADGVVSADHSRWLHDALRGAGAESRLLHVADANHEDPRFGDGDVLGAVAGFLTCHLRE